MNDPDSSPAACCGDSTASATPAAASAAADSAQTLHLLHPWENGVIDLFVSVSQRLGIPRSIGQIYGLLYCREAALPMDEIIRLLGISKGSASQGLRTLRQLNAVKLIAIAGDRRDHYKAESSLRKLVSGFLCEQVEPHLATGKETLANLTRLSATLPPQQRALATERIETLRSWNSKTAKLLPMLRLLL